MKILKKLVLTSVAALVVMSLLAAAQSGSNAGASSFNWSDSPDDIVLEMYAQLVKKTIIRHPDCPKVTITTKTFPGVQLSAEEQIEFIEAVLEMHGIHLEPYGEKFVRALPSKNVRKEGIPIIMDSTTPLGESTKMVSMMIPFLNISAKDEAKEALEGLKSDKGILLVFERTNSILVTDTEQNINRMIEVKDRIDQSTPVLENVFVRQIKFASADEIKTALEAIVQDSKNELEKNNKQVNQRQAQQQQSRPSNLIDRIRAGQKNQPATTANESLVMSVSDADRGMIRGKTLILSDERSNKLIIVTMKSNMDFFDRVIEQLDIETTPETVVKVYRLKYADSEDVSDMINDLIGNAASSKNSGKANQNATSKSGGGANLTRNSNTATAKKPANQRSGEAKAGELSKDNTTVLSDKRINGLVVMTRKELVPVIESIIESMDVKLSQVLIETMILQVNLSDEINTGIDWIHKISSGPANGNVEQAITGGGGSTSVGKLATLAEEGASSALLPGSSGLSYYFLDKGLDIGALIKASKSDSHTKLVASPIVMTVDNKEATIEATKMRYLLKGYTYSGSTYNGSAVPDYEQKEIGLTVKITPKINPNGTVMLEVEEEFSSLGESQTIQAATGGTTNVSGSTQQAIGGIQVETTVTRKLSADITVDNRQTVILGGLSQTEVTQEDSGIPILKDIPWIGRYLFGSTKDVESRQELLMFMTPYVLDDSDGALMEAKRRKSALSDAKPWDDHGWSASPLADPVSLKEQLRRKQREWANIDEDYKNQQELQQKIKDRAEDLKDRAEAETERRAKEADDLVKQINAAEEKKAEARAAEELKIREQQSAFLDMIKSGSK